MDILLFESVLHPHLHVRSVGQLGAMLGVLDDLARDGPIFNRGAAHELARLVVEDFFGLGKLALLEGHIEHLPTAFGTVDDRATIKDTVVDADHCLGLVRPWKVELEFASEHALIERHLVGLEFPCACGAGRGSVQDAFVHANFADLAHGVVLNARSRLFQHVRGKRADDIELLAYEDRVARHVVDLAAERLVGALAVELALDDLRVAEFQGRGAAACQ
ncbi:hypothetical protein D9M68_754990 [compost metagenome]